MEFRIRKLVGVDNYYRKWTFLNRNNLMNKIIGYILIAFIYRKRRRGGLEIDISKPILFPNFSLVGIPDPIPETRLAGNTHPD